jgi:ParB family chromosome partitioning protein
MIIAGERRFRAHQILDTQLPGLYGSIKCLISQVNDEQLAIDAIIENDQRVDVSLMEQARSYDRMIQQHGYSIETLAKKLGKRAHIVQQRVNLLNLTPECQKLLEGGNLYQTQADALAGLSARGQSQLLKQINSGACRTVTALKGIAQAIADAEAQTSMFGDDAIPAAPAASVVDINTARGFEAKVENIAAMLRQGIDDNVIVATRKVNPGRAATLAEMFAQMQKDLHRLESAFRIAAVQEELAA